MNTPGKVRIGEALVNRLAYVYSLLQMLTKVCLQMECPFRSLYSLSSSQKGLLRDNFVSHPENSAANGFINFIKLFLVKPSSVRIGLLTLDLSDSYPPPLFFK